MNEAKAAHDTGRFLRDNQLTKVLSYRTGPSCGHEFTKAPSCQTQERSLLSCAIESHHSKPSETSAHRKKTWRQRHLSGWRTGALTSCVTALIVLLINISVTLWATSSYSTVDRIATLFHGSCEHAKSINMWLQLAINILSTLLLGASNYCMQCLSSPTRDEVDKAHSKRSFLHIGVPSGRNLMGIGWKRKMLWLSLGLSALPLHFVCVVILRSRMLCSC